MLLAAALACASCSSPGDSAASCVAPTLHVEGPWIDDTGPWARRTPATATRTTAITWSVESPPPDLAPLPAVLRARNCPARGVLLDPLTLRVVARGSSELSPLYRTGPRCRPRCVTTASTAPGTIV